MKNDDLTYDWLDFVAEQKLVRKKLIKEQITKIPNNLRQGNRTRPIKGIVIHHTVTDSPQGTLSALGQRASTNYEIDKQGNVYEYIDPNQYYAFASNSANEYTIAIDVTTGDGSWPKEQINATKSLIEKLAKEHGFELSLAPDEGPKDWKEWEETGYTLFRHRNFHATACPVDFPMDELISKNIVSDNGLLKKAYDYIGDIGSSAYEKIKSIFSESLDKKIFDINDKTKEKIYKKYQKYFDSLLSYLQKELKLNRTVIIVFEEDEKNGKKALGRTGGYINHENKIHIFCSGRHVKDIMRSLAHELVHHGQNIRGEFKDHHKTINGYAQKDKHLRRMEKEAYLKGNIHFRDWEDNYKYRGGERKK